jgi:hypothetical protein
MEFDANRGSFNVIMTFRDKRINGLFLLDFCCRCLFRSLLGVMRAEYLVFSTLRDIPYAYTYNVQLHDYQRCLCFLEAALHH